MARSGEKKPRRLPDRYRVALLIESSRAYGLGLLQGIARFARTHNTWSIYQQERGIADDLPRWLRGWQGHGILARIETKKQIKQITEIGLPVVDLNSRHDIDGIPVIDTAERRVVRLALEHLIERGYRRVAFCGFAGLRFSERRLDAFQRLAKQSNLQASVFESPRTGRTAGEDITSREGVGLLHEQEVARWIRSLTKPVGVIACNDACGQQVLNACREFDIPVPEEVAVIGVDNDEMLCDLADPPMSSVEPDTSRIGYEAAALLDRMMRGEPVDIGRTAIDPLRVVVRRSTDHLAIDDRNVAAAIRFIREHACSGITVEDVLEHVQVSRTTLDKRFLSSVGRTPKAEILRVRIDRIKSLLAETDYTLPRISQLVGVTHAEYVSAVFKRETGMTPSAYRAQHADG